MATTLPVALLLQNALYGSGAGTISELGIGGTELFSLC